jgi:hypothetical protein
MNRTGSINNTVKSKPLNLTLIDILKPPPTPKSKEPKTIYRLLSFASVLPPAPVYELLGSIGFYDSNRTELNHGLTMIQTIFKKYIYYFI